jgi:hypothetical protein
MAEEVSVLSQIGFGDCGLKTEFYIVSEEGDYELFARCLQDREAFIIHFEDFSW